MGIFCRHTSICVQLAFLSVAAAADGSQAGISLETTSSVVSQCQQDTCIVRVWNPIDAGEKLTGMIVQVKSVPGGVLFKDDSTVVMYPDEGELSGDAADPANDGRTLTWDFDAITGRHMELVPGETITICFTVTYRTSASTVALQARLQGEQTRGGVSVRQTDTSIVRVHSGQVTARVESGPPQRQHGDGAAKTIERFIHVQNDGLGDSYNLAIVATLGHGLSYVPGSATLNGAVLKEARGPDNTIVWDMRQFDQDPDGPGGLDDLDGDGQFDDMAAAEALTVSAVRAEMTGRKNLSILVQPQWGCGDMGAVPSVRTKGTPKSSPGVTSASSETTVSRASGDSEKDPGGIEIDPPVLYLRNVSAGSRVERDVLVRRDGGGDFAILSIKTNVEGLVLTLQNQAGGHEIPINCVYNAPERAGRVRGYIDVGTDQPGVSARVRVSGNIVAN